MGIILGGVSASDLIMDGKSVSLYVGGNPPIKVWPIRETVQITLGTGYQARDQFRAALTARGMDYRTVTKIPFDIELVGTGVTDHMFDYCSRLTAVPALNTSGVTSMRYMFRDCKELKKAPAMDTNNVTDMTQMFYQCSSMTYVPDMHTSQARVMSHMFYGCSSLTDGNVRLIGKHPSAKTNLMIYRSGLTREPFYDTTDGQPGPTGPRVVTLQANYSQFSSPSGDLDLLSEITFGMARFTVPVTCDRDTWAGSAQVRAGGWINAGAAVQADFDGAYVFTEIL